MSRYAIGADRPALLVVWATGRGDTAHTVADLPAGVPENDALALAQALSGLSHCLWRTYTHPASATDDVGAAQWRELAPRA